MLNLNSELVLAKKAATTAGKILQEKKVEKKSTNQLLFFNHQIFKFGGREKKVSDYSVELKYLFYKIPSYSINFNITERVDENDEEESTE